MQAHFLKPQQSWQNDFNKAIVKLSLNQLIQLLIELKNNYQQTTQNDQKYGISKVVILRKIAIIGYCYPVLMKLIENILETIIPINGIFSITNHGLTSLLETLNIFCEIKGFYIPLLKITDTPKIAIEDSQRQYKMALWFNCLPSLSKNKFYPFLQTKFQTISKKSIIQVRDFINSIIKLKQIVQKQQQQCLDTNPSKYNHKFDQLIPHQFDIQAVKNNNLIVVDYIPDDYKTQTLQLWIDRTVQLNSILGNFVCKERFGQFQYVKGPLMYAMQKGITMVMNNFQQISHELLTSLKSLTLQFRISHNQKIVQARSGFKIIGVLGSSFGAGSAFRTYFNRNIKINSKKLTQLQNIPKVNLTIRTFKNIIEPVILKMQNKTNIQYLTTLFESAGKLLTLISLKKLLKRIQRLRLNLIQLREDISQAQKHEKIWDSYYTQSFKEAVQIQILDLCQFIENYNKYINFSTHIENRFITFQNQYKKITIGRAQISIPSSLPSSLPKIVPTQYSLQILEKISICNQLNEAPLLISQTGCGKTTLVQFLAQLQSHKLYVYNMSSGSDVMDLVGGFKPVDCKLLIKQLTLKYIQLFRDIPTDKDNSKFLQSLLKLNEQGKYEKLIDSILNSIPKIKQLIVNKATQIELWNQLQRKFRNIKMNLDKIDSNLVFTFIEGNLLKALKQGDWVLIDEVNMATNDILQKIVPLIQGKSLFLYEKGDLSVFERNPSFRIFACMNPANDSGKKPLPANLIEKFTVITLQQPSRSDIIMMTTQLCPNLNAQEIADIFFQVKKQKTVSLRNLSRALSYINKNKDIYTFKRAVYDGLMLGFGHKRILEKYFNETQPKPKQSHVIFHGFLLEKGKHIEQQVQIFHLTDTFIDHLKDFLRAIAGTELPVLLQGPTSAGKTSMIRYVAAYAGHKCIRINNHQHTEIEQYIGNYFPQKSGKLIFRQGPLVQAVRNGYWLILDQLNLARTQILQCLNRLLDDNRQLFLPEQQKHIKPHKNFRIFATQNPSSYSGRKTLSKAFRNRFVSISFNDLHLQDTMAILSARIPLIKQSKEINNYVKYTLNALMNYRQRQRVFSKDAMITIRDLLKWASRQFKHKEGFMRQGFAILAQRLRTLQQKQFVEKILLNGIKATQMNIQAQYQSIIQVELPNNKIKQSGIYVQMNQSFRRMAALTIKAVKNNEPVLLVGQTGCGKTTLAQLLAALSQKKFYSINCHKHMQASDLLGSLRPSINSNHIFQYVNGVVIDAMLDGAVLLIDQINTAQDSVLQRLNQVLENGVIGVERGEGWQTIKARPGFCVIATMNPSGDYGKKQLSPALRNRFTEIWVQPITHPESIKNAMKDITEMINTKLNKKIAELQNENGTKLANLIYNFIRQYNCVIAPKYEMQRKLMTMRDIGWVCHFINNTIKDGVVNNLTYEAVFIKYYWSIRILAIEGMKFTLSENYDIKKVQLIQKEIVDYVLSQAPKTVKKQLMNNNLPALQILKLLQTMTFPVLIKTDLPIQMIGISLDHMVFFSSHTDLNDLLGQYKPISEKQFQWQDRQLLKSIKQGGIVGLFDLNMAQQPVIEGVNSLFDHRRSIFVVQLNTTYQAHQPFLPIVILKDKNAQGRKGLPNSVLNRFVKLWIQDVPSSLKIDYLKKKYPSIDQNLEKTLNSYLQQYSNIDYAQMQLLCQLYPNNIEQSMNIFSAPLKQVITNTIKTKLSKDVSEEKYVLQHLPLIKQFQLFSDTLVQKLISMFTILKNSKSSIFITGKQQLRQSVVEGLAYLLKKPMKRILLSTMVDMNDLLGSYQQITVGKDQQIKVQSNIQEQLKQAIFQNSIKNAKKQTVSKFLYIESNIVKAMHDGFWLIYIQIPNSLLLQKIQKGLRDIYLQNYQIIVGMESDNNISNYKNTKFVHIQLQQHKKSSNNLINLYTGNLTNFRQIDTQLRMEETMKWVQQDIKSTNDRESIEAYSQILKQMNGQTIDNQMKMAKIKQFCISKLPFNYKPNSKSIEEPLFHQLYKKVTDITPASTYKQFQYRSLVKLLFIIQSEIMNNKITLLKKQYNEQYLSSIALKFKILYFANLSNFRKQSQTVLKILYQNIDEDLLQKFFKQIERMYEELRNKVLQVCVKFNEDQFMTIVPVKDTNSLIYSLFKEPQQIILLNYRLFTSYVGHNHLEKELFDSVLSLKTSISEAFKWSYHAKIRQFPMFKQLWDKFYMARQQNSPNIDKSMKQILKIMTNKGIIVDQNEQEQTIAKRIISIFSPNNNLEDNMAYHIEEELNMQCLNKLIKQETTYISTYNNFIKNKYTNYQPLSYRSKKQLLDQYLQQQKQLAKKCLYRGHNNLLALKDFYQDFSHLHSQLVQSNFSQSQLKRIVIYLYDRYYDRFSDILLSYLLGLCYLHYARQKNQMKKIQQSSTGIIQKFLKKQAPASIRVKKLIESTLNVQQLDAIEKSKQYLKLQKKFNREVIIDEYTEEGKQRRKQLVQEDFLDLFNRRQQQEEKTQIQISLDSAHLLMNAASGGDQLTKQFIREHIIKLQQLNYQQVVAILSLLEHDSSSTINIYNHINSAETNQLAFQLSSILQKVEKILKLYPGHSVSSIASLCSKVYQQPIFKTELYKILADCQQIITKIFEINATLPRNLHVPVQNMVYKCLRLRRIECANWKQLINVKIWRRQKADMIQFIDLARMLRAIETTSKQQLMDKQCFMLFDRFMNNCPIICHKNRLKILKTISAYSKGNHMKSLPRIIGFYEYLSNNYLNIMQHDVRVERIKDMKQYEKLAGWSSNEFLIFRATCEKFQRKIHTVLKKYEQQLSGHVGQYHKILIQKEIKPDIETFYSFIISTVNAVPEIISEQQDQQNVAEAQNQNKIEVEQPQQQPHKKENIQENNTYEQLINKIFQQIHQIKQSHHTAQSRLLILRGNINQLQDFIQSNLPSNSLKQCDYYPQQWMFQNTDSYQRACKYFYGFWDKLCQRNQSMWQKDLVQTFWNLIEKIWLIGAQQLPQPKKVYQNENIPILKGLLGSYHQENKQLKYHPIFKTELSKAKTKIQQYQQIKKNSFENIIQPETISLFKLGYILSNIAVNLQKNGLCAKADEKQQNDMQEDEQIGEGLGIGEGDIHQGAEDVGQQIQFQEQVQGQKGQQQHDNPADKEEENGINMEGQFQGQMHEKQKKQGEQQKQQEGEEADQEMGSVDDEKKEQDMKNEFFLIYQYY